MHGEPLLGSLWVHTSWVVVEPHMNTVLIKDPFMSENRFISEQNEGSKHRVHVAFVQVPANEFHSPRIIIRLQ